MSSYSNHMLKILGYPSNDDKDMYDCISKIANNSLVVSSGIDLKRRGGQNIISLDITGCNGIHVEPAHDGSTKNVVISLDITSHDGSINIYSNDNGLNIESNGPKVIYPSFTAYVSPSWVPSVDMSNNNTQFTTVSGALLYLKSLIDNPNTYSSNFRCIIYPGKYQEKDIVFNTPLESDITLSIVAYEDVFIEANKSGSIILSASKLLLTGVSLVSDIGAITSITANNLIIRKCRTTNISFDVSNSVEVFNSILTSTTLRGVLPKPTQDMLFSFQGCILNSCSLSSMNTILTSCECESLVIQTSGGCDTKLLSCSLTGLCSLISTLTNNLMDSLTVIACSGSSNLTINGFESCVVGNSTISGFVSISSVSPSIKNSNLTAGANITCSGGSICNTGIAGGVVTLSGSTVSPLFINSCLLNSSSDITFNGYVLITGSTIMLPSASTIFWNGSGSIHSSVYSYSNLSVGSTIDLDLIVSPTYVPTDNTTSNIFIIPHIISPSLYTFDLYVSTLNSNSAYSLATTLDGYLVTTAYDQASKSTDVSISGGYVVGLQYIVVVKYIQ